MGWIVRTIIAVTFIFCIAPATPSQAARLTPSPATPTATRTATPTITATPTATPTATAITSENGMSAGDAEKAGSLPPPPPYDPTVVKFVDPGMPTPEPEPSPGAPQIYPTPTATATPKKVRKPDNALTPGQIAYRATRDTSYTNPINWSVTILKKRHQLTVYYKGRLYKTYRAVFGRSFELGTKLWEGDRRTPEGVYAIVEKHVSRRWLWFLTLNYPNQVDRRRYELLREGGIVPAEEGTPLGAGGRIGIHGTDNPILNDGSVNWTTGCISVDNQNIVELYKLLPVGTVVIIKP